MRGVVSHSRSTFAALYRGYVSRSFARASRFGADSPRRVRLIGLDLRNELGIPQQCGLMRRHHDSGREGWGVISFVIHESEVATRAGTETDCTCGEGPDGASQPRSRFAAMSDQQAWMQRLDDYLHHRRSGGKAEGGIADAKSIVGRWICFALEHSTQTGVPEDDLLDRWVTEELDLAPNAQNSYRSHVRQWWKWNEGASVPTVSGPTQRLERLVVQFRATGYPGEDDQEHLLAREQHERTLRSLDEVSYEDRGDIKPVWATNNQNYG